MLVVAAKRPQVSGGCDDPSMQRSVWEKRRTRRFPGKEIEMTMSRVRKEIAAALLAICGFAAPVLSQVSRGTITGRVIDPSGAVVPDASVIVLQTATGSRSAVVTNAAGEYTAPFLAPGSYSITVTVTGFDTIVRRGIQVGANQQLGEDFHLQLGQHTETVTVEAGGSLLETVTGSVAQELNSEDLANLPVDGNTPLVVAQLAVGVLPTGNPQFFHPYDNSGPSGFSMGGAPAEKNELLLDGAPDSQGDSTIAYNPPMDAAEEVKVEAFEPDAAYGHTAGGTVNQVLKSGTDRYHGTVYEYGQYSALDDTNWFTKAGGQKKPVSRYNQFGATFGGPLVVPKLYNGHDRVFYFLAYEGIYDNSPTPSIVSVPTLAERKGDFSALLPLGSAYTIYDPYSAVQTGSTITRQGISYNGVANVIPPSELNPVGLALANYYPAPNYPGLPNGENNFYNPGNSTDSFDSEIGRIDVNITSRNKMFFDFRHNNRYHTSGNIFGNQATGSILVSPNWGSTLDDVHVFTARTVWENRLNWTRNITSRPLASSVPLTSLGFPASLQSAITKPAFPVTSISPFVGFGYSKGQYLPFDSYQIFSMVSHAAGKHSLEFGADLRLYKESSFSYGNSAGSYSFNGGWTNGPTSTSGSAPVGQELAALELGLPVSGSIDVNTNQTTSAEYFALFVQDNFRMLPRLELNLGLRYEHDLPTVESDNRAVNGFATSTVSPINAQVQANYAANPTPGVALPALMGGLVFATPSNRSLYQTRADDFSPRVGLAWTPLDNTVVHAGFGIFNDSLGRQNAISPGYNQTTQMVPTTNNYLSPATTLSNPFPNGLLPPPGNSLGLATYLGQAVSFYPAKLLNDYAIRYIFNVQQQFPGNTLFEIGYIGSHLVHLPVSRSLDGIPAQYLNVGQVRNAAVVNRLSQSVTNPFAGQLPGTTINGSKVALSQLLLPYPQYTGVTLTNDPVGSSLFNMLEARLEKRMSHGVRFLVNYAWSKNLDRLDYLNPEDTTLEKRISPDDRPQHLVASATWELPFGENRQFNSSIHAVNYLIGGWNLTPIYTFQPDGAPLVWGDLIYLGGSLNSLKVNPHNPNGAFNTALFDRTSADQPVTADHIRTLPTQVTHARGDGIDSLDLSIAKITPITEKLHMQLRGDFFNFLNRPQFAAPATSSATSSGFGKITSQANLPRQVQVELKLIF